MTKQQIFPLVLIILDLLAAVVYGVTDMNVRKVVYWVAAAVLTITVTFRAIVVAVVSGRLRLATCREL